MLIPLKQGGQITYDAAKEYIKKIVQILHGIAVRPVGVQVTPEERVSSILSGYICRHLVNYMTSIDTQSNTTGLNPSILKAKIALDALFDSQNLINMPSFKSESIILTLASSIKDSVLVCLSLKGLTIDKLELCCPMFKSVLIEQNVKVFAMQSHKGMLDFLLSKKKQLPDSMDVGAPDTPQHVRLYSVKSDIQNLVAQGSSAIFVTQKEYEEYNAQQNSLVQKAVNVLVLPERIFNSVKQFARAGSLLGLSGFKGLWEDAKLKFAAGKVVKSSRKNNTGPINPERHLHLGPLISVLNEINRIFEENITEGNINEDDLYKSTRTEILKMLNSLEVDSKLKDVIKRTLGGIDGPYTEVNLDNLLETIANLCQMDTAHGMGKEGTSENVFLNGKWWVAVNLSSTRGIRQTTDETGKMTLVRLVNTTPVTSLLQNDTMQKQQEQAVDVLAVGKTSLWNFFGSVKDTVSTFCSRFAGKDREGEDINIPLNVDTQQPSLAQASLELEAIREGVNEATREVEIVNNQVEESNKSAADLAAADLAAAGISQNDNIDEMSGDGMPGDGMPGDGMSGDGLHGGKSRRKSRKNAKKTTRRNKKIVRKSSKNTKQQRGRSSRRHRSSRKSRK